MVDPQHDLPSLAIASSLGRSLVRGPVSPLVCCLNERMCHRLLPSLPPPPPPPLQAMPAVLPAGSISDGQGVGGAAACKHCHSLSACRQHHRLQRHFVGCAYAVLCASPTLLMLRASLASHTQLCRPPQQAHQVCCCARCACYACSCWLLFWGRETHKAFIGVAQHCNST